MHHHLIGHAVDLVLWQSLTTALHQLRAMYTYYTTRSKHVMIVNAAGIFSLVPRPSQLFSVVNWKAGRAWERG